MSTVTERTIHPGATPIITLVVALAENGVIGSGNRMPWHLPADLKRFKALTMGKPILMGRKTFEAIGRPLPGRRNIVLSRSAGYGPPGIEVVGSVDEALAVTAAAPELMVIGGAEIYRLFLSRAQRMHLTRVHAPIVGDTRFPNCDWNEWRKVDRSTHPKDEKNAYAMTFLTLERIDPALMKKSASAAGDRRRDS
jgi:dihydrofolate reductase